MLTIAVCISFRYLNTKLGPLIDIGNRKNFIKHKYCELSKMKPEIKLFGLT